MKNLAKVITLILAVSLIATGCNLLNKEEKTSTETQVVNADTILDQQIFQRAIGSKDAKACATIKDEAVKIECANTVDALALMDKAVAKLDDDFCGDIKLERYESECEARVAAIVEQQKAEEKKQEEYVQQEETRRKIEAEAIEKQDYRICEKITDSNQMNACKYNSIVDLATTTHDSKLCENIGDIDLTNQCNQIVGENTINLDQNR